MKCEKCKYWDRDRPDSNFGDCKNAVDEMPMKPDPTDKIYYYADYIAGFQTGKDFGCIHFEDVKNG